MCTDVSDLNIEILFKELWNNAKIASFFYMNPEFERQIPVYTAPKKYNTGFWYHDGRALKIDLTNLKNIIIDIECPSEYNIKKFGIVQKKLKKHVHYRYELSPGMFSRVYTKYITTEC